MPTIPIYRQQTSVSGVPNMGRVSGQAMAAPFRAVEQAGQQLGQVVQQQEVLRQRQEEEDAKVYAGKVVADTQLKWREEFLNRSTSAPPGAPEFTPSLLKDFDAYSTEAVQQAPTEAAKRFVQQNMLDMRTRLGTEALSFESNARVQNRFNLANESINSWTSLVAQSPDEFTVAQALQTIEQTLPDVGEANRTKLMDSAKAKLTEAFWLSQLERDPAGVKSRIDSLFQRNKSPESIADLKDTTVSPVSFGARADGQPKGTGFLGALKRPDGSVSTEMSVGVNLDGREMEIPTLVPTLNRAEVETLLNLPDGEPIPEPIMQKATEFARSRMEQGKPVFAQPGEEYDLQSAKQTAQAEPVIDFIMGIEGGFVENDAGAGPTNFGINSRANPDIDVRNLTKGKAAQIYKERYWDAIGADQLPPAAAIMAMDAAVNQGVGFAKELIEESGGDVNEMARLRIERYEEIIAANPAKAEYGKGWMSRVEKVRKKALAMDDVEPVRVNSADKLAWSSGIVRMTPVDQLARYRNQAEQSLRQQQTVMGNQLKQRLADSAAMAERGIADPQPLDPLDFQVFGEQGPALFSEYNKTQKLARDISSFGTATNAQLLDVVTSRTAEAQPGAGFAAATQRDSLRKQAAARTLEMREKDPVGYVFENVPEVKAQMNVAMSIEDLAERSVAMRQAVDSSIAAQQRLGIAEPRILSGSQRKAYGERITAAQNPQQVMDLVQAMETDFGKDRFRPVMTELLKDGALSNALMIIPDLDSAPARELVARLSFVKAEDLRKGVDKDDASTVKDNVREQIADLAKTIPAQTLNDVSLLNAYSDTAEKMALQLVQNGEKPGEAADKAAKMLWGKYRLEDTLRVPQGVDYNVKDRVSARLQNDGVKFDVPPDLTGAFGEAEFSDMWQSDARANTILYTAPDGSGVELWAMTMNGIPTRLTRNGQPVTYSFDELKTQAPYGSAVQRSINEGKEKQRQLEERRKAIDAIIQGTAPQ